MRMPNHTTVSVRAEIGLRALILDGHVAPGERLREVTLSEKLAVSRTPLREALMRLEGEGLLERGASGGYCVKAFTLADARDAIELRGVLEGTALRAAAERGLEAGRLARANALLDELDGLVDADDPALIDLDAYCDANMRFHAEMWALPGSRLLSDQVERIARLPFASPSAFLQDRNADLLPLRRSLVNAQFQHRAMIEAVATRQGARAEALAREHCRLALDNLERAVSDLDTTDGPLPAFGMVLC